MPKKGYIEQMLATRVREIQKAVAGGSPTKLARLMNDVPANETASRTDERGLKIETDRRMIGRWLAADALMGQPSRLRLLAVANRELLARGREPFPDDFLDVDPPDPLVEINQKLDLLLQHFGLEIAPDALASEAALQLLEQTQPEPDGRDERRSGEGAQ